MSLEAGIGEIDRQIINGDGATIVSDGVESQAHWFDFKFGALTDQLSGGRKREHFNVDNIGARKPYRIRQQLNKARSSAVFAIQFIGFIKPQIGKGVEHLALAALGRLRALFAFFQELVFGDLIRNQREVSGVRKQRQRSNRIGTRKQVQHGSRLRVREFGFAPRGNGLNKRVTVVRFEIIEMGTLHRRQ